MGMIEYEGERRRRRGRSLAGPLVLITVGVLLLLNTLEVLPWDTWQTIWRFWPLVLVLIGVELVLGRGNPWLSALIAFLVIAAAASFAFITAVMPGGWSWQAAGEPTIQQFNVPLENARDAAVSMQFGAGHLTVSSLGNDTASLLAADLRHYRGQEGVQSGVRRTGDHVDVTIRGREGTRINVPGESSERWDVRFNPSVPLDLRVQGGAANVDLDLGGLDVRNLMVDMGAATTRIRMPEAGQTRAQIKTGMADLRVEVPEGVAARITTQGGLSSFEIDESRFPRQGSVYVSPDFETAANRVELIIDAGMASVRVR